MRIVGLKEFLTLPSNTIYQRYDKRYSSVESRLEVKGSSLDNDFLYMPLQGEFEGTPNDTAFDSAIEDMENGIERQVAFGVGCRDGLFNPDALFAVWSDEDVRGLIEALTSYRRLAQKHKENLVNKES